MASTILIGFLFLYRVVALFGGVHQGPPFPSSAIIVARAPPPQTVVTTGLCHESSIGFCNMLLAPSFLLPFLGFFLIRWNFCVLRFVRIPPSCFKLQCFTPFYPFYLFQSVSTGSICFAAFLAVGADFTCLFCVFYYYPSICFGVHCFSPFTLFQPD